MWGRVYWLAVYGLRSRKYRIVVVVIFQRYCFSRFINRERKNKMRVDMNFFKELKRCAKIFVMLRIFENLTDFFHDYFVLFLALLCQFPELFIECRLDIQRVHYACLFLRFSRVPNLIEG